MNFVNHQQPVASTSLTFSNFYRTLRQPSCSLSSFPRSSSSLRCPAPVSAHTHVYQSDDLSPLQMPRPPPPQPLIPKSHTSFRRVWTPLKPLPRPSSARTAAGTRPGRWVSQSPLLPPRLQLHQIPPSLRAVSVDIVAALLSPFRGGWRVIE